jgi:hypothetical protein
VNSFRTKRQWDGLTFFLPVFIVIGLTVYLYKENISGIFVSPAQKTVDKALHYFKYPEKDNNIKDQLFSLDYLMDLLMNHSFNKIDEWKLITKRTEKYDKVFVQVEGLVNNVYGGKYERKPMFLVEKINGEWVITDSFDFFIFNHYCPVKVENYFSIL